MSVNRLLSLIADQGGKPRRSTLARWTETPDTGSWEQEPDYGAFVDEHGLVVPGTAPARAFLQAEDPSRLQLAAPLTESEGTLVFVDWGRQTLPWGEIFSLWEKWDRQGLVLDCGAVSTAWALERRWVSPGWVLFRGDFDGAPLATTVATAKNSPEASAAVEAAELSAPKSQSFLAIAKALRGEKTTYKGVPAGNFPMLPFTLQALSDPAHPWPQGL